MIIQTDSNNRTELTGRIVEIHEYSKDKAANISISVETRSKNKTSKSTTIQTKCFTPAAYNAAKIGMFVKLYCHISPGSYEKNGKTVYSQDVITDFIEFLEAKSVVEAREAAKDFKKNYVNSAPNDDDIEDLGD